jgi:hypothetical protein
MTGSSNAQGRQKCGGVAAPRGRVVADQCQIGGMLSQPIRQAALSHSDSAPGTPA